MSGASEQLEQGARHLADARSSVFAAMRVVGEISPGQASELKDLFHATDDALNRVLKVQATLEEAGL